MNTAKLFLRKLTLRRAVNIILIGASYYISKWIKKPVLWGRPVSISIEPTTSCNLRCPECPSGLRSFTRPTGMLDLNFYTTIIDQVYRDTYYLTFYFQGEPFLNPEFLKMIQYASGKNMFISTSTNAHFINSETAKQIVESKLDQLIISIDGTTQDTYEQYRVGGSLTKVIEATEQLVYWKSKLNSATPYLIFQFLVVKPNEHQIDEVTTLANKLNVNEVRFKTAQIYDYKHGSPLIPTNDKYSRYKRNSEGNYILKNKLLDQCWKMWHSTVITWDGKVLPCCFDKDAKHQLGSLKVNSVQNIWNSREYNSFRASLLKSRSEIDICTNCSEGTKVWG